MWIKICGIRTLASAKAIGQLPIQAIGLNFYNRSKRYVTPNIAQSIVTAIPSQVVPVGLFVNHSLSEILDHTQAVGLRTIQLHGDESPELIARLSDEYGFSIIRALRPDPSAGGFESVEQHLAEVKQLGGSIDRLLVDAAVAGEFGGTGHQADWKLLAEWLKTCPEKRPPVVLAGGLNADNVHEGILATGCDGVDVASGVEDDLKQTDPERARQFVQQAQRPL